MTITHFFQSRKVQVALSIGAVGIYILIFFPFYFLTKAGAVTSLSIIPVIILGWFWGLRVGLLAGLLSFLPNTLLLNLVGYQSGGWDVMIRSGGGLATVIVVIVGVVVGRLHDIGERVKKEIIERKKHEKNLRESEERLRSTLSSMDDLVFVLDKNGVFINYYQMSSKRELYAPPELFLGKSFKEVLPPHVAKSLQSAFNTVITTDTVQKFSYFLEITDEKSWFDAKISKRKDSSGEFDGVTIVARDITEQKQAEEELARQTRELARSNSELEQFAYAASHDLQEPLRMVASYTQLLARRYQGKLDSDADEFISFAVDGATRMQRLINDLLAYSRLGSHGAPFESTDLETVFDETVANLQIAIGESRSVVTHDPLPTVIADGGQMGRLFQNLISNAIKFRNESPPQVHISAKQNGEQWIFSACDNGIGIDPEFAERIFVIFQRLHTREEYSGTGIGLAICKKIVERHGGHMWVESQLGKGAAFYFTIPMRKGEKNE